MKFKLNPTQQIILVLGLISLGAILANPGWPVLIHLLSTLGFSLILFAILKAITKKPQSIYNSAITGLIIFLVLHYSFDSNFQIYYSLGATFIAILSKFFLKYRGSSIFNPTALGILIVFLITKLIPNLDPVFISWWGTAYKTGLSLGGETSFLFPSALFLMIIWIIFGLNKWRKWPIFLSFLIAHFLLMLLRQQDMSIIRFIFTDATIYFFAAIMLIDPKTSPILKKQQILFGLLAAITYNAFAHFGFTHPELIAILIANLYFFGAKIFMQKPKQNAETNV